MKKKEISKSSTKKKSIKKTVTKPKSLSLPVLNIQGKEVEQIELETKVFDGKISEALLHQAVVAYLANQRKGLASTKTRGEVQGSTAKPWRQKGTGRARVGSIRSPLWRGGGVTFGPKPRSYYKELPHKMKTMALKSALNAKLRDKEILILSDINISSHKTKDFSKILKSLKLDGIKIRLIASKVENDLKLATRNIKKVLLAKASDVHTKEVIDCKKLVLTKGALRDMEERVKKCLS